MGGISPYGSYFVPTTGNPQVDSALAFANSPMLPPGGGGYGYGSPYSGSNLMSPGSPLDYAYNYLDPQLSGINQMVQSTLASLPPPGSQATPQGTPSSSSDSGGGPSAGGLVEGAAGGAAIGAVAGLGVFDELTVPAGAVIGGIVGGIASLF